MTPEERRATAAAQSEALAQLKDELVIGDGLTGRAERHDTIREWFDQHGLPHPTSTQIAAERSRRLRPAVRQASKDNLARALRRLHANNPTPEGPDAA